jgi:hypothetical protein
MNNRYIWLAVEGTLDEQVLRRVLRNYPNLEVSECYGKSGKDRLKTLLKGWNKLASAQLPLICLIDLDNDDCAPGLISTLFPHGRNPHLICRIVEREVEAWLLADRENIADFLGVRIAKVPLNPDWEPDPKTKMVDLARQSRKKRIRDGLVPKLTAKVGPEYVSHLTRFVVSHWNITTARTNSPSLERALLAIEQLAQS